MFCDLDRLVGNWRVDAVACGTAAGIASMSIARSLIEPTAGSDPRDAMAVERLKRSFGKAATPRNTKVLKISANLYEPALARGLSLHSAEQTVKLGRSVVKMRND